MALNVTAGDALMFEIGPDGVRVLPAPRPNRFSARYERRWTSRQATRWCLRSGRMACAYSRRRVRTAFRRSPGGTASGRGARKRKPTRGCVSSEVTRASVEPCNRHQRHYPFRRVCLRRNIVIAATGVLGRD